MKYLILLLFVWSCSHEDKKEPTKPTESTDSGTPSITSTVGGMPHTQKWQFKFHHSVKIKEDTEVAFIANGITLPLRSSIESAGSTKVMAIGYISLGSSEKWRDDYGQLEPYRFVKMKGWPGEYWLDLSKAESILPIMYARIDAIKARGLTGFYGDNPDISSNTDQSEPANVAYLKKIAAYAHKQGLMIGLNNALQMLDELQNDFDFFLNEQCIQYSECHYYDAVVKAGKPIYGIEYKNRHCKPVKGHNRKLYKTEALKEIEADCN